MGKAWSVPVHVKNDSDALITVEEVNGELLVRATTAPDAVSSQRKYQRAQQRWGNLKRRIQDEIQEFSGFTGQQGAAYANRIAGLRWVLDEMSKSPDVLVEAVSSPCGPDKGQA